MNARSVTRGPLRTLRLGAVILALVAVATATFVTPADAAWPDQADEVQVYEGDVFEIVGSTLRHPSESTEPSAPIFNNAGVNLGLTWGQWSAASATSDVRSGGLLRPRTDIRLTFTGLVPNGVYSVFWGTLQPDSENPLCPGVERTLALPSTDARQKPDASSFVASSKGKASFHGRLDGNLLESASQVFINVIYHSNGQTYGPLPNAGESQTQGENCRSSFGDDAMRHLQILQQW